MSLSHNISFSWPDPVLAFYPDNFWTPKHMTTSSGSWSAAENGGSGELSGIHLSGFNASSVYVLGTTQWSNLYYNASLVPDGPVDNIIDQSAAMEDITYGFHNGHPLFIQQGLSDEVQTLDVNMDNDMQNSTYDAYTNIMSIEQVVITIDIPSESENQEVVNRTVPYTDFDWKESEWQVLNDSLTPQQEGASLTIPFSGSNFFLVSGEVEQAGFSPLQATLDGNGLPTQGQHTRRSTWEDAVLLFLSGLEDTDHVIQVSATTPLAIKYGLVFQAGEGQTQADNADLGHSGARATISVCFSSLALAFASLFSASVSVF